MVTLAGLSAGVFVGVMKTERGLDLGCPDFAFSNPSSFQSELTLRA